MSESIECAVIGAGVVGLAVARALAKAGREVVVIEAAEAVTAPDGRIQVRAGVVPGEAIPRSALFPGDGGDAIKPEPGPYVFFEVEDDGCGMNEETRSRIFDPFFTTKKEGTGLGLATVHRIVEGNGGHVKVETAIGRGTRFCIVLPSADRIR